jgi:hypothetical protein
MKFTDLILSIRQRECKLLHNIGDVQHINYNTREQIIACDNVLTFDGVYLNVFENRDVLKNKTGIFFIVENLIGKDNSFELDKVPKLEKYCDWYQIKILMNDCPNFFLGFHSKNHLSLEELNKLDDAQILDETTPSYEFEKFVYKNIASAQYDNFSYAYPYGQFNQHLIEIVKYGYPYAFSVTQGIKDWQDKDYPYAIYRNYLY